VGAAATAASVSDGSAISPLLEMKRQSSPQFLAVSCHAPVQHGPLARSGLLFAKRPGQPMPQGRSLSHCSEA
jgi:hypothetical protein